MKCTFFNVFRVVFCLILFILNSVQSVYGQDDLSIDSLKHQLSYTSDTIQVAVLLEISSKYQGFQPDSAMTYGQVALSKAKQLNDPKLQGHALLNIGRLYRDRGEYGEALRKMFQALKLFNSMDDKIQVANAYNDISIVYALSNGYNESLQYFNKALKIFNELGDEKGQSYALNNIGIIYQEMGNDEEAKEFFMKSLVIKEKHGDANGISRAYVNLGSIFQQYGNEDEALIYYFKADSIFTITNDFIGKADNYTSIAAIMLNQERFDEALRYARQAYDHARRTKSLPFMRDASRIVALILEKKKNYKEAYEYQKIYQQINDSLLNESSIKQLNELKARFNTDQKEEQIQSLEKDRAIQSEKIDRTKAINSSLIISTILLLASMVLLYYAYKVNRSKKNELAQLNKTIEKEKDHLDKQNQDKDRLFSILSHDIKSPLSSLKGFSYLLVNQIDLLSKEELEEMGSKIDQSLDNLTELIDNLMAWSLASRGKNRSSFEKIDVMKLIDKDIRLYTPIAEAKNIKFVIESSDEVYGFADIHAIDTVLRNLISNSIKFSYEGGEVMIRVVKANEFIKISVIDKGMGMIDEILDNLFALNKRVTQSGTKKEKGNGLGLILCKELIEINGGNIYVESKPKEGSTFTMTFLAYTTL